MDLLLKREPLYRLSYGRITSFYWPQNRPVIHLGRLLALYQKNGLLSSPKIKSPADAGLLVYEALRTSLSLRASASCLVTLMVPTAYR
jgi:hypothetical protein